MASIYPSNDDFVDFDQSDDFSFINKLEDVVMTIEMKTNLFSVRECLPKSAVLHLAALLATNVILSPLYKNIILQVFEVYKTDTTIERIDKELSKGFNIDFMRYGNTDKNGYVIRGHANLARVVHINCFFLLNGEFYAKTPVQKVRLAQVIAGVLIHECVHVLHGAVNPGLDHCNESPPQTKFNRVYRDAGELAERFLWGGDLQHLEPRGALPGVSLTCAVEAMVIVTHGVERNVVSIDYNPDWFSKRAMSVAINLEFPGGSAEDAEYLQERMSVGRKQIGPVDLCEVPHPATYRCKAGIVQAEMEAHAAQPSRNSEQSSNVTCEDLSGMSMEDFFVQVYKSGTTEFYIFYGLVFLYVGISSFCFLRQLFTGKVKSFISVIAMIILSWNQGSLFRLSHYQNDLYHLNGNVMHHSSFTVGGDNAALVNTLPPGLIINFIMNYVTIWMMTYVIFDYLKLDKWVYLNLAAPMMVAKLLLQMKVIHPYIHTQHKSWYGPWFAKYIMDEYKGHVLCHHVSGYCLGDAPTYTWFYDRLMFYHGKVYELGYLTFGKPEHYLANMGLDYFLLITIFGFMFITVLLTYPFLQKAEVKDKAEKAAKKVN